MYPHADVNIFISLRVQNIYINSNMKEIYILNFNLISVFKCIFIIIFRYIQKMSSEIYNFLGR